jgi:hypothetical protein
MAVDHPLPPKGDTPFFRFAVTDSIQAGSEIRYLPAEAARGTTAVEDWVGRWSRQPTICKL